MLIMPGTLWAPSTQLLTENNKIKKGKA